MRPGGRRLDIYWVVGWLVVVRARLYLASAGKAQAAAAAAAAASKQATQAQGRISGGGQYDYWMVRLCLAYVPVGYGPQIYGSVLVQASHRIIRFTQTLLYPLHIDISCHVEIPGIPTLPQT